MKLLIGPALACALALGACASVPHVSRLDQGKADAAAWDSLHGVASTLDSLARSGLLKGSAAATAKLDLDKAAAVLTAADAAYQAGDNGGAAQNLSVAMSLIAEIKDIVQKARGT